MAASGGFVVKVIANAPDRRVPGDVDPKTLGQVLEAASEDFTTRILSFEYEDSEAEHDVLRLTVDNHDLFFFDHPAFTKGNVVKFFFGYPGKVFGPRYAVVDNTRGRDELVVTCLEEAAFANQARTKLWPSMTRAEVVRKIVASGAFQGVTNVDIDASSIASEGPREWSQARQTDWQFLLHLAEDPGFEVFVEGDVLHFHPRRLSRAPARKFTWFYGLGELLDWSIDEWRTADRAAEVEVAAWDPTQREARSSTGSDSTTERSTLGNQNSLVWTRLRSGELVAGKKVLTTAETDPANVKQIADAHYRLGEQGEVKITAAIQGDPLLRAKQVVELAGISRALSGNYYVTKHQHRIDGEGYVGTLHLIKNAMTALPSSDPPTLDPAKADENRQHTPQDPRKLIVRGSAGELFIRD